MAFFEGVKVLIDVFSRLLYWTGELTNLQAMCFPLKTGDQNTARECPFVMHSMVVELKMA